MSDSEHRDELLSVIGQVRNRWRLKLALRGAVVVVGGSLLALLLSATSLEALRFSPTSIIVFRILILAVFAALAGRWLFRPLMRHVSDEQVALYLEEQDPSLETAILSAVESSSTRLHAGAPASEVLVQRLIEQAIEKCRAVDYGRTIEAKNLRQQFVVLTGVIGAVALLLLIGPAFLRQGLSALLMIQRSAEAAAPYRIEVTPGNATVPRNSDLTVKAKLSGFQSSGAELLMRRAPDAAFERVPLVASADASAFEGMLFHLDKPVDYYVESNGVRSPTYTLTLVDLPAVEKLELEYHYPAYTNLPPQKIENGGDVAALKGTVVHVRIEPTMATPSGRILLNDSASSPLTHQADGSLTGMFTIDRQGFYRIELKGPHGEDVMASPQYTIDVLEDRPPVVTFTKPGRDTQASPVEELFVEAHAEDDFGVKQLELVYTVNGGSEKTVKLFDGKPLTTASAGHTIYLEELGLNPGDFVSYYAKASDNDGVKGSKTASSDIYFVKVRPFRKDYKPAPSMGGGGGGAAGGDVGQLSEQQRQIVAATFNVVRDRAKMTQEKFNENTVFLTLAEAKLREQVDELVQKMASRQVDRDPNFKKIGELLTKASPEMKSAEAELRKLDPKAAMLPEQTALKYLQEAETEYETYISTQNGGGGGGGAQTAQAEDLADLFELELDKLASQYEMQQRAEQQGGDQQINELADKLKELARRQEQEAERQRRAAASGQQNGSGSGVGQRALADQVEEAARKLQQLTREQQRQELGDVAKRLQDAADAMRRAAANGSRDGGAQAAAAQELLKEAQKRLEQGQSLQSQGDVQSALKKAEELSNEQRDVKSEVEQLDQAGGSARASRIQRLGERKDAMTSKLADLEKNLQKLADDTRKEQREVSRKLDEAATSVRTRQMKEKLRYSKSLLDGQQTEFAKAFEGEISNNLEELRKKVGEAAGAMGGSQRQASMDKALEQARNLVRGMQSLEERMRQQNQQGQGKESQGKDGQGKDGQQGKEGQGKDGQGQGKEGEGKEGQSGQGQAGQGQGRGQQGERGQQAGRSENGGQMTMGGATNGPPQGGSYYGDGRPGQGVYNGEDIRQMRRELREWQGEAEALRRQLSEAGMNNADLNELIGQLRGLDNDRVFADPRGLQQLQASALERVKKFEFDLRKKLATGGNQLSLSGSDAVPPGFRQAIEEYYRALAKKGPTPRP